jgi:hypothetical protein
MQHYGRHTDGAAILVHNLAPSASIQPSTAGVYAELVSVCPERATPWADNVGQDQVPARIIVARSEPSGFASTFMISSDPDIPLCARTTSFSLV